MVKLYMFQAWLAHHQEFRNCVSVQGFVGPGLVCTPIQDPQNLAQIQHWQTKNRIKNNWIWHLAANTVPELLMMSESRSKHVEFYHQIKSIKSCISLVFIWSLCTKMHGPMNIKNKWESSLYFRVQNTYHVLCLCTWNLDHRLKTADKCLFMLDVSNTTCTLDFWQKSSGVGEMLTGNEFTFWRELWTT